MRIIYFICLLSSFLYSYPVHGQFTDVKVVSTTGNTYILNNFQLDWTLGEIAMHTIENGANLITEGMQQPVYDVISSDGIPGDVGNLKVYPNPTQDVLNIEMNLFTPQKCVLELYDFSGIKVWSKTCSGKVVNEEYSIENLPSGQYLLSFIFNNNQLINTYPITKF